MRKFGLLAAAAGLMIGGSVANADFVITSTRTQNAFTLNSVSYDTVDFFVHDTAANGTNGFSNQIDLAMYDSSNKNGMLISASTQTINHVSQSYPDLFAQSGEASLPQTSWLKSSILTGVVTNRGGSSVVNFNGSVFTFDQAVSNGTFANQYTDQQLVGGLGADETWSSGSGFSASTPVMFAQATVQHGDSVTLVTPVNITNGQGGRVLPSTTWDTGGTVFGADGTSNVFANTGASQSTPPTGTGLGAYTDAVVPEPASIGFLGLAAGGLLARRRRQA